MQPNASCQPNETEIFSAANIRQCRRYVRSIQRKLDRAVASGDKASIRWYYHILSKRSQAAKILAVHRITKLNDGRFTAGVDGIAIPKGSNREAQDKWRHRRLIEVDVTKQPEPIRRVFIPKSNGKLRPLGILILCS
jgi:RNA-directed DNA polymerase